MKTKFFQSKKQKTIVLFVILFLLLTLAGAIAYLQLVKPAGHLIGVTPQMSAKASASPDTVVHAGPSHDSTPSPTVLPPNPDHPASATLAKPTGQILSTNSVSLSSNNTNIDSTCVSVNGASCYIQATMGGHVVKVSETKTISDGAQGVELLWDANQLGVGTWSVQAEATVNGQQAASDAYALMVNK